MCLVCSIFFFSYIHISTILPWSLLHSHQVSNMHVHFENEKNQLERFFSFLPFFCSLTCEMNIYKASEQTSNHHKCISTKQSTQTVPWTYWLRESERHHQKSPHTHHHITSLSFNLSHYFIHMSKLCVKIITLHIITTLLYIGNVGMHINIVVKEYSPHKENINREERTFPFYTLLLSVEGVHVSILLLSGIQI